MSKTTKCLPYNQSWKMSIPSHSQHAGKHKALLSEVIKLCEYSARELIIETCIPFSETGVVVIGTLYCYLLQTNTGATLVTQ